MNVKIDEALARIKTVYARFGSGMFSGHSGGKDSVVLLHLAQQVSKDITIVHNVKPLLGTSGDPLAALSEVWPETLAFMYSTVCKENEVQFMHSSKMKGWIARNQMKCQLDGARACEWDRQGKSSDLIVNGINVSRKNMPAFVEEGIFGLSIAYPIFDWSDAEVFAYIEDNNLALSEEYTISGELPHHRAIK